MSTATKPFASGCMPHTDFQYEEFEGFLASYYLTYLHLNESGDETKIAKFKELEKILNSFAERHNVQIPQEALKNVRATEEWGKPHKIKVYFSVKDGFNAFRTDFGLYDNEADKPDIRAMWELVNEPTFVF